MTISQLVNSKANTIVAAASILFLAALVSRVLGLARNALLSWRFGASEVTDIYFAAFRIPDFIFGILIMGGISVVFLPLFSEYANKNKEEAWRFASNLMNVLFAATLMVAAIAFVAAPLLIKLVAPGFSDSQEDLAVAFTRLMLLSPILFGISAAFSGVLQYFDKFIAYSLAPIMYNLGIITGIVILVPFLGVWGLPLGVVLGAFLHLAVQIPAAVQSGFKWQRIFQIKDPSIVRSTRMMIPRIIAAAGFHFNLIVMTALASIIGTGSITIFQYANDVQYIPIGLIGVSFAVAAFPAFSRFVAEEKREQLQMSFSKSFSQVLYVVLPSAVLLFLFRAQIIRLIYGTGEEFGWEETRLTAAVLGIFAFGVLFQSLIPLLVRIFFAMKNTVFPTMASISTIILNIALALMFIQILAQPGVLSGALRTFLRLEDIEDIRVLALPLALGISGMVQFVMLVWWLSRSSYSLWNKKHIIESSFKMLVASGVAAGAGYVVAQWYGEIIPLNTYVEVLVQVCIAGSIALLTYAGASIVLKIEDINMVKQLIRKIGYARNNS